MNGTELHLHIFQMHSYLMCESFFSFFLGGGTKPKGLLEEER